MGTDEQQPLFQQPNSGISNDNPYPSFNQLGLPMANDFFPAEHGAGASNIAPNQRHSLAPYDASMLFLPTTAASGPIPVPPKPPVLHHDQHQLTSFHANVNVRANTYSPQHNVRTSNIDLRRHAHDNQLRSRGTYIPTPNEGRGWFPNLGQSLASVAPAFRGAVGHASQPVYGPPAPRTTDHIDRHRANRSVSAGNDNDSSFSLYRGTPKEGEILQQILEVIRSAYQPALGYTELRHKSRPSRRSKSNVIIRDTHQRSSSPRRRAREPQPRPDVQVNRTASPSMESPFTDHEPGMFDDGETDSPVATRKPHRPRGRSRTPRREGQHTSVPEDPGWVSSPRKSPDGAWTDRGQASSSRRVLHQGTIEPAASSSAHMSKTRKRRRSSSIGLQSASDSSSVSVNADGVSLRDPEPGVGELEVSGLLIDPWIDGKVHKEFTREDLDAAHVLQVVPYNFTVHWAMRTKGVPKRGQFRAGDPDADDPTFGKVTRRKCLGVFRCPNWNRKTDPCRFLDRPSTKEKPFQEQFNHVCPRQSCGKPVLQHVPCKVTQEYRIWKDGATFDQSGPHRHPRPSIVKHLTPKQRSTLHDVLKVNPKLKGSALRTGGPNMVGPVPNVRSISSVLGNLGRIAYEVQIFKKSGTRGMSSMEMVLLNFADIQKAHPGIIRQSSLGPDPIHITFQSDFMRNLSVRPDPDFTKSNNGLVTDAAMKYFRNSKLMVVVITSTYVPEMTKWVPVCMTAITGQTQDLYEVHFLVVFEGIHGRCIVLGIVFEDEYLAMVCQSLYLCPMILTQ